jgi:hypothetical protein
MTADPLAWFDPPVCCGCYVDHGTAHHDKPPGVDAFGMVRHCPECGVHTSGPHSEACSRSGVMLGERHHRQAEGEMG